MCRLAIPSALPIAPNYPDLAGKVVVVTGGSRGIGATTCRLFAANGAKVVITGLDQEALDSVACTIWNEGGRVTVARADCTDVVAVERMRTQVEDDLGPVEILVAFAGCDGEPLWAESLAQSSWGSALEANLNATLLAVKTFLPAMVERRRGSIITMALTPAREASSTARAAARTGVSLFSRHVADEVGRHGVRVNCIAPVERTHRRSSRALSTHEESLTSLSPRSRLENPVDVACAALFLASDCSSWLSGATLDIGRGRINS